MTTNDSPKAEWDDPASVEHFRKYAKLADDLGVAKLIKLVPFSRDRLTHEIQRGNTFFNQMGGPRLSSRQEDDFRRRFGGGLCSHWDERYDAVLLLQREKAKRTGLTRWNGLSLAEAVCVLKHVARYYVVGEPGPDGPIELPYGTQGLAGLLEDPDPRASSEDALSDGLNRRAALSQVAYEQVAREDKPLLSIDEFIAQQDLTMEVVRVAPPTDAALSKQDAEWQRKASHWSVLIRKNSVEFVTKYSVGSGHKGEPTLRSVLDSLASDVVPDGVEFEEWASDLGMDTDSRRAESIYRACRSATTRLRDMLGAKSFDLLVNGVERL